MIGETISHYKILSKLGEGGMGVVYKAEDTKLDRTVALKFLTHPSLVTEEEKTRFVHEAKAAAALDHPNICTVYEIGEHEGKSFISMSCVEGQSLKEKIDSGPLKVDEVLDITTQIAKGLQKAHEKGVTHRDIKPANIMITEDGVVKIMDFGLAKLAGATIVTKEGTTLGTVSYMSPEQARGQEADHRTDIWSLGVVMYEMLTGQLPFKGEYETAVVYSLMNVDPEPVTSLRSGIPLELEMIVNKCLEKDKTLRYQHADDLIADIQRLKRDTSKVSIDVKAGAIPTKEPTVSHKKSRTPFIIASAVVIILVAVASILFWPRSESIESIAVLPLDNLSGDPEQEYFSDGMTEALISELSHIRAIRVISRTSVMQFKGARRKSLPEIARELNVDAIVEGTVLRSEDRVRITVQLIEARTDRNLWAQSYEGEMTDILTLQSEVARAIADEIEAELTPQEETRLVSKKRVDPEAFEAYFKGRYFWNKRTEEGIIKSIEYFKEAIEEDPAYALAYAGIADSYITLGDWGFLPSKEALLKARAAAAKALEIDDLLAEAYNVLAFVKFMFDWDWSGAERDFKRAIELNPGYSTAHHWYALYLIAVGRHDEAVTESKRAQDLDPLSLIINSNVAYVYVNARRYDRAIEQSRKTIEIDANFYPAYLYLGMAYEQKGMFEEAITEFKKMVILSDSSAGAFRALGHGYAVSGRTDEALKLLDMLNDLSKYKYVSPYGIAAIYTGLDNMDQAFRWLEKAYEERDVLLSFINTNPWWDPLRDDPRFKELLKKMGFDK